MKILNTILKKLTFQSRDDQNDIYGIINSTEDFKAILKRERARADRGNKKFSLIIFEIHNMENDISLLRFIIKYLSSRVRLSDVMGWYDEKKIGILLPDTSQEGAQKLADEINNKVTHSIASPVCTIYVYPSPTWPGGID